METWSRQADGMDLLKDIKSELRGGDERTNDDGSSATSDDAGTESESVERSTTASGSDGESVARGDESVAGGSESVAGGAGAGDSPQSDEHLCSFCETEFDASRDVCPECDAEIVLRGAR